MSKGAKSKKPVNRARAPGPFGAMVRNPKFTFVLICFVVMLYASVGIGIGSLKISIMLFVPILILLVIMGAERYIWSWIVNASLPRRLISGFSLLTIGSAMALVSSDNVLPGILVIAFAVFLMVYGGWRFAKTKDMRSKGQDIIMTLDLILFMGSILLLVLGVTSVAVFLVMSSMVVFFYRSWIFNIVVIAVCAALLFTTLASPIFGAVLLVLGVIAEIGGLWIRRKLAIQRKLAAGSQTT